MATVIDAKRNSTFPLKLADEERSELEAFVARENARLPLGKVTMTDVIRAAVREYLRNADEKVA